jgi:hypothetical protein
MKASDLRIGNLVYFPVEDDEGRIKNHLFKIYGEDIFKMEESKEYLESHKPILLTEEWFVKLGFIKSGSKLLYLPIPEMRSEIHFEKQTYGNVITLQSSVGMFIPNDILYVHQLQNLYHSLTGKELEIKETK